MLVFALLLACLLGVACSATTNNNVSIYHITHGPWSPPSWLPPHTSDGVVTSIPTIPTMPSSSPPIASRQAGNLPQEEKEEEADYSSSSSSSMYNFLQANIDISEALDSIDARLGLAPKTSILVEPNEFGLPIIQILRDEDETDQHYRRFDSPSRVFPQSHNCKTMRKVRPGMVSNYSGTSVSGYTTSEYKSLEPLFARWVGAGTNIQVWLNGCVKTDLTTGSSHKKLTTMMSAMKALVPVILAHLHEQKRFVFNNTVASYWPAFGQNGKEKITVLELFSMTACVPVLYGVVTLADRDIDISGPDYHNLRRAAEKAIPTSRWMNFTDPNDRANNLVDGCVPGKNSSYMATSQGDFLDPFVRSVDKHNRSLIQVFEEDIVPMLNLWLARKNTGFPDRVRRIIPDLLPLPQSTQEERDRTLSKAEVHFGIPPSNVEANSRVIHVFDQPNPNVVVSPIPTAHQLAQYAWYLRATDFNANPANLENRAYLNPPELIDLKDRMNDPAKRGIHLISGIVQMTADSYVALMDIITNKGFVAPGHRIGSRAVYDWLGEELEINAVTGGRDLIQNADASRFPSRGLGLKHIRGVPRMNPEAHVHDGSWGSFGYSDPECRLTVVMSTSGNMPKDDGMQMAPHATILLNEALRITDTLCYRV